MLKISSKNTFILKEVDQPYRGDKILHMQLQQEAFSTTCLGLPVYLLLKLELKSLQINLVLSIQREWFLL